MSLSHVCYIMLANANRILSNCRVYSERQELNQQILGQLTDTAAMNTVECLMQKQEYVTPHSRANIVHAEKHQQPAQSPIACPAPIKTEEHIIATDMDSAHDQLPVLLAQLEQNLARELRHISEQDYVTLTKLLKPVQVWTVFVVCRFSAFSNSLLVSHNSDYAAGCMVHCSSIS